MKRDPRLASRALWLLSWASALSCGRAEAQASESPRSALRVVVRVCNERDAHAFERLRGQTSDLPVSLVAQPNDALEPSFEQRLARAERIATEQHGAAVVWFDLSEASGGDDTLIVYVATPADGRVLVRRVESATVGAGHGGVLDDAAAPQTSSAALEQAALVVRFALQGLAQGGSIGVDGGSVLVPKTNASVPQAEPTAVGGSIPPAAEPQPVTDEPTTASSEGPAQSDARALWLALGYELAVDGFAPAAEHALRAQVSLHGARWESGVFVAAALPAEREAVPAGMRLQRLRFGAALAARWPLGASWSLSAGGQAGALLQHRATLADEDNATARSARWNAALALGPEASVHMRSTGFGLQLGAGLDWIPSPTRFVVRGAGQDDAAPQPFALQPRVFVAGELAP